MSGQVIVLQVPVSTDGTDVAIPDGYALHSASAPAGSPVAVLVFTSPGEPEAAAPGPAVTWVALPGVAHAEPPSFPVIIKGVSATAEEVRITYEVGGA